MTVIHTEDRQLPQRPKTAKASEQEATYVRNAGQLKASLDPYRWGSKECERIIETLIGALRPARIGSEESKIYRYFTDLVVHWSIKPYEDKYGLVRFALYQCGEGGILPKVKKDQKRPPDKTLFAPDLFAFLKGPDVPLTPSQRSQWKCELESVAFGKEKTNVLLEESIPLTLIEHPSFLFDKEYEPAYFDEYGNPIEERIIWSHINHYSKRKIQRRSAEKIFEMATWFQNEWRMGAKNGFPCIVKASDDYLAEALGMKDSTARNYRTKLEELGIIAKAYQYDSATGSKHFGYLPGTGPQETSSYPTRTEESEYPYIRPLSVLRQYREAFGLMYPQEIQVMERWERESEREDLI